MNLSDIKTELERGLRTYKAFESAKEIVDAISSQKQYEGELVKSIDELKKVKETVNKEVSALIVKRKNSEEAIAKELLNHAEMLQAEDKKSKEANKAATAIATQKAGKTIAEAEQKVIDLLAGVTEARNTLVAEAISITEQVEVTKQELAAVTADLESVSKQYESIKSKLTAFVQ